MLSSPVASAARTFRHTLVPTAQWLSLSPVRLQVILVSWSVDTDGHVFPASGAAADEDYPHVVVDRDGIEWAVREVPTPQSWARASRCLVLSSRECVRRIWSFPTSWRSLDAEELLRLGRAD